MVEVPSEFQSRSIRSTLLLLYAARGVRGFGDGFAVIILPAYLSAIGFSPVQIGIVATAALLGSSLLTLVVGFVAPRHDLRTMLLLGAMLTVATGIVFPNVEHIAIVLLVAFVGTINPQSGDSGILVPLEHAMLARGVADGDRTRAFARYSLTGALATAAGSLAAATPDLLVVGRLRTARLVPGDVLRLRRARAGRGAALPAAAARAGQQQDTSTPLGPSRWTVYKLAALFSLDSFAGGLVVQSLLALWLFERFDLSLSAASLFFFWTSVLTAFSYPVAAWLSRRIGLINTMVYHAHPIQHLPDPGGLLIRT